MVDITTVLCLDNRASAPKSILIPIALRDGVGKRAVSHLASCNFLFRKRNILPTHFRNSSQDLEGTKGWDFPLLILLLKNGEVGSSPKTPPPSYFAPLHLEPILR